MLTPKQLFFNPLLNNRLKLELQDVSILFSGDLFRADTFYSINIFSLMVGEPVEDSDYPIVQLPLQ